jgi:hypothetical protein
MVTHDKGVELETEWGKCRIRPTLVTLEEFAAVVRQERYFNPKFWGPDSPPEGSPARARGGDEVLRRIGYQWTRRAQPVQGVSWFEAVAFCKSKDGRLPWYAEWKLLQQQQAPRFWKMRPRVFSRDHKVRSQPLTQPWQSGLPEWCGEWYHPYVEGPATEHPWGPQPTRRVAGWTQEMAIPSHTGAKFGFRVVYPLP